MRAAYRLVIVVGEAVLMVTAVCFPLELIADNPLFTRGGSVGLQETAALAAVLIPIGAAAWWMFRKLAPYYPRREARAAAIAFAVFTPVSLLIALLLAQIPGSYALLLLGNPSGRLGDILGFTAAFVAIAAMTALVDFLACGLSLRIVRRIGASEQAQ